MTKQTKTIEDYPEKWLSTLCKERTGMSLEKFKQEYHCEYTPEKMLIYTSTFHEMQSRINELTEQNKELQSSVDEVCYLFRTFEHSVTPKQYQADFEHLKVGLRKLLNKESK